MGKTETYIGLVKQAQSGDKASLERLVELARAPLVEYVYRLTLRNDLAQDIVQESMVDMFRFIGKLDRADRFWPWLRRIAFNKVCDSQKESYRHKTVSLSDIGDEGAIRSKQGAVREGVADLINQELKQVILSVDTFC